MGRPVAGRARLRPRTGGLPQPPRAPRGPRRRSALPAGRAGRPGRLLGAPAPEGEARPPEAAPTARPPSRGAGSGPAALLPVCGRPRPCAGGRAADGGAPMAEGGGPGGRAGPGPAGNVRAAAGTGARPRRAQASRRRPLLGDLPRNCRAGFEGPRVWKQDTGRLPALGVPVRKAPGRSPRGCRCPSPPASTACAGAAAQGPRQAAPGAVGDTAGAARAPRRRRQPDRPRPPPRIAFSLGASP